MEQHITALVAERVVDLLEAIQVDQQNRHLVSPPPRGCEGLLDPVAEECPIGKRGQIVVEGEVLDLLDLAANAFRDPAKDRKEREIERDERNLENARDRKEGPLGSVGNGSVVLIEGHGSGFVAHKPDRDVCPEGLHCIVTSDIRLGHVADHGSLKDVSELPVGVLRGAHERRIARVRDHPVLGNELDEEDPATENAVEEGIELFPACRRDRPGEV